MRGSVERLMPGEKEQLSASITILMRSFKEAVANTMMNEMKNISLGSAAGLNGLLITETTFDKS